jgi:hypothetical protein
MSTNMKQCRRPGGSQISGAKRVYACKYWSNIVAAIFGFSSTNFGLSYSQNKRIKIILTLVFVIRKSRVLCGFARSGCPYASSVSETNQRISKKIVMGEGVLL